MTPPTIVVLGGLNMDLIGVVDRLPEPGETISGEQFFTTPGGKGANQAVAAARMGARVKMVGRVGDDLFGPILRDGMRANGIDVSAVALDEANPTGVAMILLDATKENYIVAVYGANMACSKFRRMSRWKLPERLGGVASLLFGTPRRLRPCQPTGTRPLTSLLRTSARPRSSPAWR